MPYLQEIKLAVILLAVAMVYIFLLRPRLHKKKQEVLERYIHVQAFSINMQDMLLRHILQNDAMKDMLMPGITFQTYLRDLQKKHAAYLSDKHYKKLKKQNIVFFYLSTNRMLTMQEERLQKVKQDLSNLDIIIPKAVAN